MSRIRTIKPDFFIDDELAELTPLNRLLFIGLWTLADCKGRLEDRPKRIRAQLHPFDDGDTNAMLQALHDGGFIQRYEVDGKRYLEVRTFTKHQRLTGKEAETNSHIPAPPAQGETLGKVSSFTNAQEGKGREGNIGREVEVERNIGRGSGSGREGSTSPAAPRARTLESTIPADFQVSDSVKGWAEGKGFTDLEAHLEAFKDKAAAKGYRYADWDAAFKTAIREDWAGLRKPKTSGPRTPEELINDHRIITAADRQAKLHAQNMKALEECRRKDANGHTAVDKWSHFFFGKPLPEADPEDVIEGQVVERNGLAVKDQNALEVLP